MVVSFDAPISYTYPNQEHVIVEFVRIAKKCIIISVTSRLGSLPYLANPIQKNQFILNEHSDDSFVQWCISNRQNAIDTFRFKYVNYRDLKKFSSDFKSVYHAPNETSALSELENVKEKWGKKYPYAISNWENNWEDVSSFFQFSGDIRRIMYTTYTNKKSDVLNG